MRPSFTGTDGDTAPICARYRFAAGWQAAGASGRSDFPFMISALKSAAAIALLPSAPVSLRME